MSITHHGVEKASTKCRILQAAVIDIDWKFQSSDSGWTEMTDVEDDELEYLPWYII